MYILIEIGTNDSRNTCKCSKKKKIIVEYLKEKGYYWSKKFNRYVDDKNSGSGLDYEIKFIEELK